jgi:hypothetical protein
MEAKKVLVKEGDVAIITCPFCREIKKMSVAQYRETGKRELRVQCSCGKKFCLCLEYRRHPRKSIRLLGTSINASKHRETHDIIIGNISLGGIGFGPYKTHRTEKDDRLQVSFTLNNPCHTHIDTQVTVRAAIRDYVGCEFNTTESFKTSLGFYLLS